MTSISIDMSKGDESAENRIFAEVVEEQTTNTGDVTLLCNFVRANYDFDNSKKVEELQEKLEIAIEAMKLARDTAYSSTQDCPKCAFIDERLSEALAKIKEIKL